MSLQEAPSGPCCVPSLPLPACSFGALSLGNQLGPHPTSQTCTGWKMWPQNPRAPRSKAPLHPEVFFFGCHPETTVTGSPAGPTVKHFVKL